MICGWHANWLIHKLKNTFKSVSILQRAYVVNNYTEVLNIYVILLYIHTCMHVNYYTYNCDQK